MATRRAKGLLWARTSDALDDFVRQHGQAAPRRAVFCTYDLDIGRFESAIMPALTRRGRQFRTLVLTDAGALQSTARREQRSSFGRYQLAPVRCIRGGVFHPKLVLLTAGERLLVGIGSANLTAGGLGANLELMLFADSSSDAGRKLAGGVARFLARLGASAAVQLPDAARRLLNAATAGIPENDDVILDSLSEPLLPQIREKLGPRKLSAIHVLTPWHSAGAGQEGLEPEVLRAIRGRTDASITVYTEGRNGQAPELGRGVETRVRVELAPTGGNMRDRGKAIPEDMLEEEAYERRPSRVHAKAYLFLRGSTQGVLVFGSANCTKPALLRPATRRGNVELLAATRLQESEIATFLSDLRDLFREAKGSIRHRPSSRLPKPMGKVLCGEVRVRDGAPVALRLEVPGLRGGYVTVAAGPRSRSVNVPIWHGVAMVDRGADLACLFPNGTAERDPWIGNFLFERAARAWVPFPVSVPLLNPAAGDAGEALEQIVLEEMGLWPAAPGRPRDVVAEEELDTGIEGDADLKNLAEARHQGLLDRLAVAAAVLRRRFRLRNRATAYARERLAVFAEQVAELDLPPHVREVLIKYLSNKSNRPQRRPAP